MKSFIRAIVFLIIGGVVGGLVALSIGTGVGVATGLAAGACSALEAAKEEGLVANEQFDQLLSGAAAKISGRVNLPPETKLASTAAECEKVLADLHKAGKSQ